MLSGSSDRNPREWRKSFTGASRRRHGKRLPNSSLLPHANQASSRADSIRALRRREHPLAMPLSLRLAERIKRAYMSGTCR
jgi:hypothetical protein